MRIRTRSVIVLALAFVGALALAGIALAAGNSTATFQFTPDQVPKDSYAKGSLFVHTHTNYTGSGTKTLRAQLNFDDDIKINAAGIPQCSTASVSGNITMKQAMAACANAKVGAGTAKANLTSPGDIGGCVLAFNGKPSGGRPTLLLFTRLQVPGTINCSSPATNQNGNGSILLQGVLRARAATSGPSSTSTTSLDLGPERLPDRRSSEGDTSAPAATTPTGNGIRGPRSPTRTRAAPRRSAAARPAR